QIATVQTWDKRMEVFALGSDHEVYYRYQWSTTSNLWSGWWHLGGWYSVPGSREPAGYAQSITVANEQDGRVDLFILGTNNAVYYAKQLSDVVWTSWTNLGGNILSFVVGQHRIIAPHSTMTTNLEVFAINTQHQYSHKWQTQANTTNWSDWNNTGY